MRSGWGVTKPEILDAISQYKNKNGYCSIFPGFLPKILMSVTSLTIVQRYGENCFPSMSKEKMNCFFKTIIHINTEIKSQIRDQGQWVSKRLLKLQKVENQLNDREKHLRITISATGDEVRLGSNTKPESLDAI